jgi:hypothetical protein
MLNVPVPPGQALSATGTGDWYGPLTPAHWPFKDETEGTRASQRGCWANREDFHLVVNYNSGMEFMAAYRFARHQTAIFSPESRKHNPNILTGDWRFANISCHGKYEFNSRNKYILNRKFYQWVQCLSKKDALESWIFCVARTFNVTLVAYLSWTTMKGAGLLKFLGSAHSVWDNKSLD